MPALVARIHAFLLSSKDVDGRVKPGHDEQFASGKRKSPDPAGKTGRGFLVRS
jgi:hypothetical protein